MHKTKRLNRLRERSIFDKDNPRSLVSMVPDPFMQRVRQVWASDDRYLMSLPEPRLRGELLRRGKQITVTDMKLRLQFWTEYDRIMSARIPQQCPWDMSRVVGHAMAKEAFYDYLNDNHIVAWILCPIEDYRAALMEALRNSTAKIQEFVTSVDVKDHRMVSLLMKVEKELHERVKDLDGLQKGPVNQGGEENGDNETGEDGGTSESEENLTREEKLARLRELKEQVG